MFFFRSRHGLESTPRGKSVAITRRSSYSKNLQLAILLRWTQRIRGLVKAGRFQSLEKAYDICESFPCVVMALGETFGSWFDDDTTTALQSRLSVHLVVAVNFRASYGKTISRPEYSHGSPVHVRRVDFCFLFLSLFYVSSITIAIEWHVTKTNGLQSFPHAEPCFLSFY